MFLVGINSSSRIDVAGRPNRPIRRHRDPARSERARPDDGQILGVMQTPCDERGVAAFVVRRNIGSRNSDGNRIGQPPASFKHLNIVRLRSVVDGLEKRATAPDGKAVLLVRAELL